MAASERAAVAAAATAGGGSPATARAAPGVQHVRRSRPRAAPTRAWQALRDGSSPPSSVATKQPANHVKRRAAVFTIVQNEPVFLPVWSRYYQRYFSPDDIFVLDHDSIDAQTFAGAQELHRVPVHRAESFNHAWLRDTVERFHAFLLQSYELVLFAEADEIVAADSRLLPGGLAELLERPSTGSRGFLRCTGYETLHTPEDGQATLDWTRPVLAQRRHCRRSDLYSKPLLSSRPLRWEIGFHHLQPPEPPLPPPDPRLLLLHLHRADFETCRARTLANAARRWSAEDLATGAGRQNRLTDPQEFERWFYTDSYGEPYPQEPIPDAWKGIA